MNSLPRGVEYGATGEPGDRRQNARMQRPHICFVAPGMWPVFSGDRRIEAVGGAEVQQSFLVRELVRRRYPVSMICMDYGQSDPCIVDGVTVHRMHAPEAGLPVVRFLHPRLTSLWSAMRRADADIYYQRTSGALTGFVAAFSRLRHRLSVFAAASDADCDPAAPFIRFGRDRALYRWGLRHVSGIVVQSERQREALARHYGRGATVVPSCYGHTGKPSHPGRIILWAGMIKQIKRPDLFIDLARRCPHYRFRLVGGGARDESALFNRICREATALPNVEMTGFVPFADVEGHFDDGSLLVNTSPTEGFPNTFLQAWSRGMPTVSLFDPDARWQGHRVGEVVGSSDDMASCVRSLMNDEARWRRISALSRKYFEAHHSVDHAVDIYEAVFDRLRAAASARIGQARDSNSSRPCQAGRK
ncbi:MAG: glycosyltransferase family 4 protein [Betaproteobacteria bacterium]|nr:MAG: glycosyltransferase family 4 protein [Betaproteobacteria bacterium]